MNIYFLLTENCNLNCMHCIRGDSKNSSVSYKDAVSALEAIHNYDTKTTLILSGGEPTIHKDFIGILNRALALFPQVVINSNGTTDFYEKELLKIQARNLIIQFSLDGDEEWHDSIRGKGNYQKTLCNIKKVNDLQRPMWISTVVSKDNSDSVKKLPNILRKFNVEQWHISPVMPFGNGKNISEISVSDWNQFVDDIIDITPFRLSIKKLFNFEVLDKYTDSEIEKISQNPRCIVNKNCGCGTKKIYIYPDLNVYACTCLKDEPLGNLKEMCLGEILNADSALKFINYQLNQGSVCYKCRYRKICNGGCIGMSKEFFGKLGYGDIRCPILRGSLNE